MAKQDKVLFVIARHTSFNKQVVVKWLKHEPTFLDPVPMKCLEHVKVRRDGNISQKKVKALINRAKASNCTGILFFCIEPPAEFIDEFGENQPNKRKRKPIVIYPPE